MTPRSFDRDIRPLFREVDRDEMEFVFDLWAYQDVRANAEGMRDLDRLVVFVDDEVVLTQSALENRPVR